MLNKRIYLITLLALSLILVLSYGCKTPTEQEVQLKTTTLQIQQAVQSELDNLDRGLSAAAAELSRTGLRGPEASKVLNGLYSKYPFIIDFATADATGKIITTVPEGYSGYEGSFIITEKLEKPVLRQIFIMVEFGPTVALFWPIFSENGDSIGSVSALFEPRKIFTETLVPDLETGMAVNVMQLDGLNIYDSQGNDAGKNLFIDPSFQPYTDLIALGHRMVTEESGSGSYTFIDHATGKTVKKMAYWATVGLHGTEWRLVSIQEAVE